MRIRIGIVTRNRADILPKAIESALGQSYANKEVWVIDDASEDATPELALRFPQVIWKRYETIKGYRCARNEMMQAPGADLFCSLDDDSWFLQGDELQVGADYLRQHPETGAIGYDIIDPSSPEERGRGPAEPAHTFIGCGHLLRLDSVAACGYYADTKGAYGVEEKDLSIKMLNRGFDVLRLPGVHVWHDKTMVARDVAQQHRSGVGNDMAFALRRCPEPRLPFVIPAKFLSHLNFALQFGLKHSEILDAFNQSVVKQIGRWGFFKPSMLGMCDFLKSLPAILSDRNAVSSAAWTQYTTRSRLPSPWLPKSPPKTVAISITTRNRKKDLRNTLDVLGNLKPAANEILVYCDRCTDRTAAMVREEFPEVLLLDGVGPPGSIAGRDLILHEAQSDIVLSLDDDSYPIDLDIISRTLEIFQSDPRIAVITFPQVTDEFSPENTQIHPPTGARANTGSFTNSGAALSKEVYLRLPGYPVFFEHAYEEPDYGLQCINAGYTVLFEPDIHMRHLYSSDARDELKTHHYHARNELWSALMRCPVGLLPFVLCYRVWRQFTYACSRGLRWVVREPLWWIEALRGIPAILRHRSKVPLRSYWNWMNLVRRPEAI